MAENKEIPSILITLEDLKIIIEFEHPIPYVKFKVFITKIDSSNDGPIIYDDPVEIK